MPMRSKAIFVEFSCFKCQIFKNFACGGQNKQGCRKAEHVHAGRQWVESAPRGCHAARTPSSRGLAAHVNASSSQASRTHHDRGMSAVPALAAPGRVEARHRSCMPHACSRHAQTSSLNLGPNTSKNIRSPSKHKAKTLAAAAKTPREQKHCPLSQTKHAAPMQSTCARCVARVWGNHVACVAWSRTWLHAGRHH